MAKTQISSSSLVFMVRESRDYAPLAVNAGVPDQFADEADTGYRLTGTFSNMRITAVENTMEATTTIKFQKNQIAGNQSISVPSNTNGKFEDTSNTDSISAGDKLSTEIDTEASHGGGDLFGITVIRYIFDADADSMVKFGLGNISQFGIDADNITRYAPLTGPLSFLTDQLPTRTKVRVAGTMKNLIVQVEDNARTTTTTMRLRINGSNGNQVIAITAGATGFFEDTSGTDTITVGDEVHFSRQTLGGGNDITINSLFTEFVTTDDRSLMSGGGTGGIGLLFNSTSSTPLNGSIGGFSFFLTEFEMEMGIKGKVSIYTVGVKENTIATSATSFDLMKNNSVSNIGVSVGAGLTGFFEDLASTEDVVATDELYYKIITPNTSGRMKYNRTSLIFLDTLTRRRDFSVDAFVLEETPINFTIDSIVVDRFDRDFTIDAFIQITPQTPTNFDVDAILEVPLVIDITTIKLETPPAFPRQLTFTVDAEIRDRFDADFLVDAYIQVLDVPQNFLVDSFIQKLDTQVNIGVDSYIQLLDIDLDFIIDAFVLEETPANFTVDSIVVDRFDSDFTIDAFVLEETPINFTIDSIVVDRFDTDFTIDSFVQQLDIPEDFLVDAFIKILDSPINFTIDAFVLETTPADFTIDAFVLEETPINFTIDAYVQALDTKDFDIDVLIQLLDIPEDFTIDSIIVDRFDADFTIDSIVVDRFDSDFTIDAYLQQLGVLRNFTIDSILAGDSIILNFTIDAFIQITPQTPTNFTIDSIVVDRFDSNFTIDSYLQQLGIPEDFLVDSYLQQLAIPINFTIDAFVQALDTKDFEVDSFIQLLDIPEDFTIDSIIVDRFDADFTIDSKVVNRFDSNFTIDALFEEATPITFTIDSFVVRRLDRDYTIDSFVQKLDITNDFLVDSFVIEINTLNFTIDAVITTGFRANFTVDSILTISFNKTFTVDAFVEIRVVQLVAVSVIKLVVTGNTVIRQDVEEETVIRPEIRGISVK